MTASNKIRMIADQKSILLQDALSDLQTRNYSGFTNTIAELFSQHLTCNCFLRSVGKESWQTMFRRIDLIDDPISFEILIAKGFVCMMCDRSDLAFQYFTDAIRMNDEFEIGYALRANIGEQHNPFLLDDCKILADKNPTARSYFLLANALRQENSVASSKYLQKTIELDGGFACAHYNLGRQYQRDGLFDCAIKEFVECLSIEPNHWCYLDLWECISATEGPEAAMKYLDVGHAAHPNSNNYHYAYGVSYKILGEYEVSRRHLNIYTNWNYLCEIESDESLEELEIVSTAKFKFSRNEFKESCHLFESFIDKGRILHTNELIPYYKSILKYFNPKYDSTMTNEYRLKFSELKKTSGYKSFWKEQLTEDETNIVKLKIYYYNHELRFGHFKGLEIQEAIETESRYVIWCIINLVHFAIDPRLFLLMKVDNTSIFLKALEINLAKWELISLWRSEQDEDGCSHEYLSYENWLNEEFGDDAETAYWNLD